MGHVPDLIHGPVEGFGVPSAFPDSGLFRCTTIVGWLLARKL
jgi:hypothetical protein